MTQEEYETRLEMFLLEVGPNPATGFFGSWAWYQNVIDQFNRDLEAQGFDLNKVQKKKPDFKLEIK